MSNAFYDYTLFATIIFAVIGLIGWYKIFEKAGEKGWKALIPIYNVFVVFKIINSTPLLIIPLCIPIASIITEIYMFYRLSKSYGHGIPFTIGLIVLPFIFLCILGFSKDEYRLIE